MDSNLQHLQMVRKTLVYWNGVIGIPGKGPNWVESYVPDKTIASLIQSLRDCGLDQGQGIEIFKHEYGNLNKYKNNPYWNHDAKMSDVVDYFGGFRGNEDLMLIYINK